MLSMQRGCIPSVNVILHARVVSDARSDAPTQNEKSTVIAYYFFVALLLSHERWIAGVSFCSYRPVARIGRCYLALCMFNSLDTSTLCSFKTDNQHDNRRSALKKKKQKRGKPDQARSHNLRADCS